MKIYTLIFAAVIAFYVESPCAVFALDQFKMLDVQVGDRRITGRVLTHNEDSCWFLHRDGRLQQFTLEQVSDFAELSDPFRAHSHLEIKKQLQTEFKSDFEVRTTRHYVVVARQGSAEAYAAVFERIYFEFVRFFRGRGLHVVESEFPLVAIVFPDASSFVKYCHDEGTRVQPGLVGFYLSSSNRVAMYERSNVADLDGTVIHEATHQVAFNTSVHSRLVKHPRWVVEGLATVFEADGIRSRQGTSSPAERVNRERFLWFLEYSKSRRVENSLSDFLRDDASFEKSPLDAYSEAWAISFFLMETHPSEYSRYLKRQVERDPLSTRDADSRLKDFTDVFGTDVVKLEAAFLRFIRKIATH